MSSSNLEARLARLEGLIHAQGNTIAEQARTITEQSSTIARLSSETQAHAALDRNHDRAILDLSRAVYNDGQWVEKGTIDRRQRAEQSWKLGGEGVSSNQWEWQSFATPKLNYFPRLPEELVVMILELCDPHELAQLCRVSYAFLARASLLLYREITLDGKQATKMFCQRPFDLQAKDHRISQHLSFSNTRKITLESGKDCTHHQYKALLVYSDRFACRQSTSLKLDSVALKTTVPTADLGFWNPVLSILDPYHVKLYGRQHDQFRYPRTCPLPSNGCPFLATWTRLESVTSMGEIVYVHPNGKLALVPTIPTRRARHIEYQIHQAPPKGEGGKTIELLDGKRVLAIMKERWEETIGLWTYLRVTLMDDDPSSKGGAGSGKRPAKKLGVGLAGSAGKRKVKKRRTKKDEIIDVDDSAEE